MKTSELTRLLERHGCYIERKGAGHNKWRSPITGKCTMVPRHPSKELATGTAKSILADMLGR